MRFLPLFDVAEEELTQPKPKKKSVPGRSPSKESAPRGCEVCPLNKVKGIKKIFGKVEGKDLALFAQSPGPDENAEEKELVGKAGQWWWGECKRVGLKRSDFDIQNVQRCFPADLHEGSYNTYLKMREPTQQEIRCCSIYTEQAVEKLRAKQILILGKVALKAMVKPLGLKTIPSEKIFWSDKLNARVYVLDHPSYFARGYAPPSRLKAFRETLALVVADRKKKIKGLSDQFAYIRKQDYRLVLNREQAIEARRKIRVHAKNFGARISVDIEDAEIDGKRVITACGFSPKKGLSFVLVFVHKDVPSKDGAAVQAVAQEILEDPTIKKCGHYFCSDDTKLRKLANIQVQGFEHDTNLSEYLRDSDAKKYGLDEIVERRFPKFSGYKMIVTTDMMQGVDASEAIKNASIPVQYKYLEKHKLFDISKLSLETLRLYNGADCDVTKRIEVSNKDKVKPALLQLYYNLSFILMDMEPNGPFFDYKYADILDTLLPHDEQQLLKELRKLIKDPEYRPGSHPQVFKAIYETLGLEYPFRKGKPNTQKKTLLMLARQHKFPAKQVEWRKLSTAISTIKGYRNCADLNNGKLRTRWWGTGTRTGRLRSGGKVADPGVLNLQNVSKDPRMQNMLVADPRWREVYKAIGKIVKLYGGSKSTIEEEIEQWIKTHMPDLMTFLVMDYGQIEMRVIAQMSGDKNLIKACAQSDIHVATAAPITGWDPEKIAHDKPTRTLAKNVVFGIVFGILKENLYEFVVAMSPPEMKDLIDRDELEAAYDRFFKRYGNIGRFHDSQRAFAKEHKYVETMFGMKQHLNIRDDDDEDVEYVDEGDEEVRVSSWRNQCINGPVQGTAHQLLECGLINLRRQPKKYKVLDIPVMDVHDALYSRVRVLDIVEANKMQKQLMEEESLATMKQDFPDIVWEVPIVTDSEAGLRLGCTVELPEEFTVGSYMLEWYNKCKKQQIELQQALKKIA